MSVKAIKKSIIITAKKGEKVIKQKATSEEQKIRWEKLFKKNGYEVVA